MTAGRSAVSDGVGVPTGQRRLWLERITLTHYRNYANASLSVSQDPVVLLGENGAGKTNFLEAISLLAPGRGLRNVPFADFSQVSSSEPWSVSARVHTAFGGITIGTGLRPVKGSGGGERSQRIVRVDGDSRVSPGILAEYVEMVWITPAMDGLFTGPAADRRRFLDRLVLCFDANHRTLGNRFERAMQQRNRLLADGVTEAARFEGLEMMMAETAVALAAARVEAMAAIEGVIAGRRERLPSSPFPWATMALEGALERALALMPAVDVEDQYSKTLARARERDRAAGRTLDGPHRTDFVVGHGPKRTPARLCSTGEQKALLLGLVLAHAELVRQRQDGLAPILLLDEVTAHLDQDRRQALFEEVLALGAQAWMTGTEREAFQALSGRAQFAVVSEGGIELL
jgi:DNA replication and repair protein RecF